MVPLMTDHAKTQRPEETISVTLDIDTAQMLVTQLFAVASSRTVALSAALITAAWEPHGSLARHFLVKRRPRCPQLLFVSRSHQL